MSINLNAFPRHGVKRQIKEESDEVTYIALNTEKNGGFPSFSQKPMLTPKISTHEDSLAVSSSDFVSKLSASFAPSSLRRSEERRLEQDSFKIKPTLVENGSGVGGSGLSNSVRYASNVEAVEIIPQRYEKDTQEAPGVKVVTPEKKKIVPGQGFVRVGSKTVNYYKPSSYSKSGPRVVLGNRVNMGNIANQANGRRVTPSRSPMMKTAPVRRMIGGTNAIESSSNLQRINRTPVRRALAGTPMRVNNIIRRPNGVKMSVTPTKRISKGYGNLSGMKRSATPTPMMMSRTLSNRLAFSPMPSRQRLEPIRKSYLPVTPATIQKENFGGYLRRKAYAPTMVQTLSPNTGNQVFSRSRSPIHLQKVPVFSSRRLKPVRKSPSKKSIMRSNKPVIRNKSVSPIFKSKERQRSFKKIPKYIEPHKPDPYTPPKRYKKPKITEVISSTPIAKRIMPKVSETTDIEILSKPAFFNNYQTSGAALDIEDPGQNKLSMNDAGDTLYASGKNGTSVINVDGVNMQLDNVRTDRNSTTVECVRDNQVILQEPNSNDLFLVTKDLNMLKEIKGLYEGAEQMEDFHDYRHSMDYGYLLWRSGQDNLSIVDANFFEVVQTINRFWSFDGRSTMPVAAVSDLVAEKIVGSSLAGSNDSILHYWEQTPENGKIRYEKPINQVIENMNKLTCMEVSYDESTVYLGGLATVNGSSQTPLIVACEFNPSMREITGKMLNDWDYGVPNRMVRMTGSEVLLIGCNKHVAVVEYQDGKLVQLASIPNLHDNEITDILMRDRFMYTTALNEPFVKVTEFDTGGAPRVISSGLKNDRYMDITQEKFSYPGLDDLHKVTTSVDGARLFCGGKGLHIFDTAGGRLNPIELDINKGKLNNLTVKLRGEFLRDQGNKFRISFNPRANNKQPCPTIRAARLAKSG